MDCHLHAPQYPIVGLGSDFLRFPVEKLSGMDLELIDLLQKYLWPTETRYTDLNYAENVYNKIIRRTLSCGTTTACYFATIHLEATKLLAKIAAQLGQRALIGKHYRKEKVMVINRQSLYGQKFSQ